MTVQIVKKTEPGTIPHGFAIKTAFRGPTDTRGSRVCATYKRNSEKTYRATVSWNHNRDAYDNHYRAALALIDKINADRAAHLEALGISNEIRFELVATGFDSENYFFLAGHRG